MYRVLLTLLLFVTSTAAAADLPLGEFDFRKPDVAKRWKALHDVKSLEATPDGLKVSINGSDPYFRGPQIDLPADVPLLMKLRLRSDTGGTGQVFYSNGPELETRSVRFPVPAGQSHEVLIPIPALGPQHHLRIDPPGDRGVCVFENLSFHKLWQATAPNWQRPMAPVLGADPLTIKAGGITLRHAQAGLGEFELSFNEHVVACGHNRPMLGLRRGTETQWLDLRQRARVSSKHTEQGMLLSCVFTDDDGGNWSLSQSFQRGSGSAIEVEVALSVDQDRELLFAPLLLIHPGLGTHQSRKSQGLFAGVEYLEDEPSSSTADIEGPAARRLVPDEIKLTFPLMAISAEKHFVAVKWEMSPNVAALFDSPDRTFGSGSHAMGLIAPASDGTSREDGALLPFEPSRLTANQPLKVKATLLAGLGDTVVPAVKEYWQRSNPLNHLPDKTKQRLIEEYVPLAAAGWLDTPLRKDGHFAHAIGTGDFRHQPAGDAVWMLEWLANRTSDPTLAARLRSTSQQAATSIPIPQEYFSRVGHLRHPVLPLLTGHAAAVIPHVRQHGLNILKQFDPDGVVRYHPTPGRMDFSRTQPSREANGLHAAVVCDLINAALFCGDQELIKSALKALRQLDRYDGTVPRGAQTWEIPLHTPDILASAHLTRAYSLGFQLTGDDAFRQRANYWAWTGVPFVYLRKPTQHGIGPYATTSVLGATHWQAPVWIGLPVQWCGAVYADALTTQGGDLLPLADLITLSGMQQVYPLGTPHQGLLPDSFNLRTQSRNVADINPGTFQPLAMRLIDNATSYETHAKQIGDNHLLIHAPGKLTELTTKSPGQLSFNVHSTIRNEYSLLMNGVPQPPFVRLNGKSIELSRSWIPETKTLILQTQGQTTVELDWQ